MSCCSRRSVLKGAVGAGALLLSPVHVGRALAQAAPVLRVGGPPRIGELLALGGSLHDHSTDSDGDAASAVIARYLLDHHDEMGLDFLALTEHSDFFPASRGGPDPWRRSRTVTDTFSGSGFTMLRGFEYTNDQENHLNVIESRNWLSHKDELTMGVFYDWLATPPLGDSDAAGTGVVYGGADGLGQFNHPSSKGPLNWDDYAFDPRVAAQMATIEVREGAFGWYWFALSQGWTVGPVMNADYHDWAGNGVLANPAPGDRTSRARYDDLRTVVLASDNSRAAIVEGLRARRTTASEQPDLWVTLRGPDGAWQGSTVAAAPGESVELVVDAGTQTGTLQSLSIVSDGTVEDFALYYRANGSCVPDPTSNDPDFGCNQHTPGYVEQQRRFEASGGRATFKGDMDAAPLNRTRTLPALTGQRQTVTVPVTVPDRPSTRPDGAHFFYALVTRSDGSRAVTSPLFVSAAPAPVVPELSTAALLPVAGLAVGAAALAAHRRGGDPAASWGE